MGKYGHLGAVLWDMDGVLVNTRAAHFMAFDQVFRDFGIEIKNDGYQNLFGMTNQQIILTLTNGDLEPALVSRLDREKDVRFRQVVAAQAMLTVGVVEWLKEFKQSQIRQAVASSGSRDNIHAILDAMQIRPFFDAIASGDECASKPDPAVFLAAAKELKVEPEDCLVIEDSLVGVQAAVAAGMKCVAITTSYPRERLSLASTVIDEFDADSLNLARNLFFSVNK